jgi:LmbE family N-acetylglucosaminyl deacetylase
VSETLLARVAARAPIEETVALVVAHPDDEIYGPGIVLGSLRRLTLVHVTDGAPRDMEDARRAGCSSWQEYAAVRRRELADALRAAAVTPVVHRFYDFPDKQAHENLVALTRLLEQELLGKTAAFTHPYEGGHPDHDACAFAVQCACELLARAGEAAPLRIEFASYHQRQGGSFVAAQFWTDARADEVVLALTPEERARKRAALDCFVTQRYLLSKLHPEAERLRIAPRYEFTGPPPPGRAHYDRLGWAVTSQVWREQARAALAALGLARP